MLHRCVLKQFYKLNRCVQNRQLIVLCENFLVAEEDIA